MVSAWQFCVSARICAEINLFEDKYNIAHTQYLLMDFTAVVSYDRLRFLQECLAIFRVPLRRNIECFGKDSMVSGIVSLL